MGSCRDDSSGESSDAVEAVSESSSVLLGLSLSVNPL